MFLVVLPCADIPITIWVNMRVLSFSRSFFVLLHEREIIFDITTVTAMAARLAELYATGVTATKSFSEFAQFQAVTLTITWISGAHVGLGFSFRPIERAWCNVILDFPEVSGNLYWTPYPFLDLSKRVTHRITSPYYVRVKFCLSSLKSGHFDQLRGDDGRHRVVGRSAYGSKLISLEN